MAAIEQQRIAERRAARRRVERERRRRRAMYRRRRAVALLGIGCLGAGAASLATRGHGGDDPVAAPASNAASTDRASKIIDSLTPSPPGPQVSAAAAERMRVPILMYHAISTPPEGAPLPELFVPTAAFAAQMQALQRQGYEAVTLDRLYGAWHGTGTLPEKPVVLTFDDGLENQYVNAAPVLKKLAWPGVLNLELNSIRDGEMSPAMIEGMIADGWEVDSHTIDHLDVSDLDGKDLTYEIADSRALLQKQFGVRSNFFCYPAGRFDKQAIAAVRAAGYLGATTVQPGEARAAGNPFKLPRLRINGDDGVSGMEAKLAGAAQA